MLTRVHGEGACEPFPLPPAPTVYMHDVSNNQLCQAPSPIAMRAQAARAVCGVGPLGRILRDQPDDVKARAMQAVADALVPFTAEDHWG